MDRKLRVLDGNVGLRPGRHARLAAGREAQESHQPIVWRQRRFEPAPADATFLGVGVPPEKVQDDVA